MWAGLRPGTPDGRPILGSDPDVQHLWYATGHGRNGVLLASLTGEITGDLLARGETDVDIAALQMGRRDVHVGFSSGQEVAGDLARERRQQYAVAAVAGGVPEMLDVGIGPEDGPTVWRPGAEG